jgi:hypothetical protein
MRLRHRMHRPLDLEPLREIDDLRRLAGDRGQQLMALDDLEVVEPKPMPGRRDEAVVGRVMGPARMVRKPSVPT